MTRLAFVMLLAAVLLQAQPRGYSIPLIDLSAETARQVVVDAGAGRVKVEVDFRGDGSWETYDTMPGGRYVHHEFPAGFPAHWVRLTPSANCVATAEFMYT